MHTTRRPLSRFACTAVLLAGLMLAGADREVRADGPGLDGWTEVPLKFVPVTAGRSKEGYEHLPFVCPLSLEPRDIEQRGSEQWLGLQMKGQPGVRVVTLETSLEIDANADGKIDAKAKGKDSCIPLKLTAEDGSAFDYLVRITRCELRGSNVQWVYQRSCVMEGSFDKTKIRLIDDDTDGVYGELGQDAIAIGNAADHAAPLGSVVNVNGKLYHAKVDANGAKLRLKPYEGATGWLDASSGYQPAGKLVWAVFQGGGSWFDAAVRSGDTKVLVPVGRYRLTTGRVYSRPQGARIQAGDMADIEVKVGEASRLEWGGPVKLEFEYAFEGRTIKVAPNFMGACSAAPAGGQYMMQSGSGAPTMAPGGDMVRAQGRAGERYWRFEPEDLTPKVHIRQQATKKIVHRGNMILHADPRIYHPAWWMWRDEYSEQVKNAEGPFEVYMEEDQFTKLWPGFLVGDWR